MAGHDFIEVTKDITLSSGDAAALWKRVGSFSAISDWHPAIESSEVEGKKRRLALVGGGQILESLTEMDETNLFYRYEILESPLPISNYSSKFSVESVDGGKVLVTWWGKFKADGVTEAEAEEIVAGIYSSGLEGISDLTR